MRSGPVDAVLGSLETVLSLETIIARLDFTYKDKHPIHGEKSREDALRV